MGPSLLNKTISRVHNMVSRDCWIRVSTKQSPFSLVSHPAGEISMIAMQPSFLLPQIQSASSRPASKGFSLFFSLSSWASPFSPSAWHSGPHPLWTKQVESAKFLDQSSGSGTPAVQWTSQANYWSQQGRFQKEISDSKEKENIFLHLLARKP